MNDFKPISGVQEGLLYDCLSHQSKGPLYLVQTVIKVNKKIDHEFFKQAVNAVTNTFENLRTTYHYQQPHFIKKIHPSITVPIKLSDISSHDKKNSIENQLKQFELFLSSDIKKEFLFEKPPLMRFHLFVFSEDDCRIVWTRHHVLMDGTASAVLLKK